MDIGKHQLLGSFSAIVRKRYVYMTILKNKNSQIWEEVRIEEELVRGEIKWKWWKTIFVYELHSKILKFWIRKNQGLVKQGSVKEGSVKQVIEVTLSGGERCWLIIQKDHSNVYMRN